MKKNLLIILIIVVLAGLFWQLFFSKAEVLGQASLTWNASTENDVAGYRVYYGTQKRTADCPQGGYAKKIDAGKNANYKLTNLKDKTDYYFSVTTYNTAGKESCFSEEMHKFVKLSVFDKFRALLRK
jgi:hypothetical protein